MNLGSGPTARLPAIGPANAARHEAPRGEASTDAGPAFELDVRAHRADTARPDDGARAHARNERSAGGDPQPKTARRRDMPCDPVAAEDAHGAQAANASSRRASAAPGPGGRDPGRRVDVSGSRAGHASDEGDRAGMPASQGTGQAAPDSALPPGDRPVSDTATDASLPDHMLALLSADWQAAPPAQPGTPGPASNGPGLHGSAAARSAPAAGIGLAGWNAAGAAASAPVDGPMPSALLPADAQPMSGAGTGGPAFPPAAGAAMPGATVASAPTGAAAAPAHASIDALAAAFATSPAPRDEAAAPESTSSDSPFAALLAPAARDVGTTLRAPQVLAPVPMPAHADAGFDDAFGSRIVWMAEQRLGHAELRVSPGHLGAIDIRLEMDGNRVSAQFNAANAEVRQALEAGMDRLRDLLGRQGMELAQSSVGGERRQTGGDAARGPAGTEPASDVHAEDAPVTLRTLRARGLLDEYA